MNSRITAAAYIILLFLMYLPVLKSGIIEGLALYTYWTSIAGVALVLGWIASRGWSR